jgi:hypothetical protein
MKITIIIVVIIIVVPGAYVTAIEITNNAKQGPGGANSTLIPLTGEVADPGRWQ